MQGVGPDTPIAADGIQSDVPYRYDLIPWRAVHESARVLKGGAEKYGEFAWVGMSIEEHLNHLIGHAAAWLAGDRTDDHLTNVLCRAMFAKELELNG